MVCRSQEAYRKQCKDADAEPALADVAVAAEGIVALAAAQLARHAHLPGRLCPWG